ncbi:MAG: thiamine-phosphate pyrophosphorylase [Planctomycetota bacterium]|jgi:thiamine-phosphate pyrophosphorylase
MSDTSPDDQRLRLILVTDGAGDPGRIEEIVSEALLGGVRCVQIRESKWTARQMLRACERLTPMLEQVDGLLLVNDRIDVVAARFAHGAQIGHRSLPPELAREVLGPNARIGYSAHDEEELTNAAKHGCDFALLSPVWPTSSKPNAAFLTVARAALLTAAAKLPVVWLGGVNVARIAEIASVPAAQRPVGVAVRSAIMQADDPQAATAELLQAWPK